MILKQKTFSIKYYFNILIYVVLVYLIHTLIQEYLTSFVWDDIAYVKNIFHEMDGHGTYKCTDERIYVGEFKNSEWGIRSTLTEANGNKVRWWLEEWWKGKPWNIHMF